MTEDMTQIERARDAQIRAREGVMIYRPGRDAFGNQVVPREDGA